MKKAIVSAIRQAVNMRTVLACVIFAFVIFLGSSQTVVSVFQEMIELYRGYHTDFITSALAAEAVDAFIPLLAVLPFSANFVDEVKTKFAYFCLIRSSYLYYIGSRILICFFISGLTLLIGVIIAWIGSAIMFVPLENADSMTTILYDDLMAKCGLIFLTGGLWSVVGMAMGTFVESKYLSYATPFIFYYLLVILYERYFSNTHLIYPRFWTDPSAWPYGAWGAAIFLIELTLVFAALFAFQAERRLQQL